MMSEPMTKVFIMEPALRGPTIHMQTQIDMGSTFRVEDTVTVGDMIQGALDVAIQGDKRSNRTKKKTPKPSGIDEESEESSSDDSDYMFESDDEEEEK